MTRRKAPSLAVKLKVERARGDRLEQEIRKLEGRVNQLRQDIGWAVEKVDKIRKFGPKNEIFLPKEWVEVRKWLMYVLRNDDERTTQRDYR